jgi:putative MFS transporter
MESIKAITYSPSKEDLLSLNIVERRKLQSKIFNMAVIVAALGYFVDVYDLVLFGVTRIPSLISLGYSGNDLLYRGAYLLNWQMGGMLIGGIIWGILGDKLGRLSVLFGSIFLYSVGNILNGTIHTLEMYALCRFVAGIGLAGELGAGITLVSETMTKEHRGFGTTLVSAFGIFGGVAGAMVAKEFDWRMTYYIGGALGIGLLILRIGAYESGMYSQIKKDNINRGNFLCLFNNLKRFSKYIRCILIGVPIWFVIGILVNFGPEFAQALHIGIDASTGKTIITNANLFMYNTAGTAIGSLFCGLLSQYLKKRRRALFYFLIADTVCLLAYVTLHGISVQAFYIFMFIFGLSNGYWSVFITIATEQFGTNIRATATTTIPNFVRGSVILMTALFLWMNAMTGHLVVSASAVGILVLLLAFVSLWRMDETYGKELNYLETE